MAQKKKLTRKEKFAKSRQEAKVSGKKKVEAKKKGGLPIILALVAAAFAFLLYANTLGHDYVLDDFSVIKENTITKRGTAALGEIFSSAYRAGYTITDTKLFRPIPKAMFAIEWQIGSG